ncbi:MAG: hypothetical protein M3S32_08260 [Acidobacteriota bacterium]|nr:hypothetical protein [Acidobacteriota bacterium]
MPTRESFPGRYAAPRGSVPLLAAGILAAVLAGSLSASFSWRTWILPFVDSPREMNVPARLAAGERLYRDVVYYYGPAGPWINAAAIAAFGRRFASLEAAGLCAAVLLFGSLWVLTARAGGRLAAFAATVWAAALCVGAPNGGSFLFPYSFGALWAFAGSFLALAAAAGEPSRRARAMTATGVALALLAKPEIGVAAAAVLLAGSWRDREKGRFRDAFAGVGIGAAIAAAGWGIACAGLPLSALIPEGPLALFSPPAEWRNVYRVMSGAADPRGSANSVATALFLDLAIVAFAWAAGSRAAGKAPRAAIGAAAALSAAAAIFFSAGTGASIEDRLPPLLAPMPILCAVAAVLLLRRPLDARDRARFFLFAFAAATASRVLFGLAYGRVTTPYSVLVFPGLAAAAAILSMEGVALRAPWPRGARALFAAVFLSAAGLAIARGARLHPANRFPLIRTPAGFLRLPADRAAAVAGTAGYLQTVTRPGDGFAGFPEGGLFNFMLGLPNPLREEQVLPGHLDAIREEEVARRIETAGPRFLAIANQPTAVFGKAAFGDDYARRIRSAIDGRYRLAASFGDAGPEARVGDPRFFVHVYERLAPAAGAEPPAKP